MDLFIVIIGFLVIIYAGGLPDALKNAYSKIKSIKYKKEVMISIGETYDEDGKILKQEFRKVMVLGKIFINLSLIISSILAFWALCAFLSGSSSSGPILLFSVSLYPLYKLKDFQDFITKKKFLEDNRDLFQKGSFRFPML